MVSDEVLHVGQSKHEIMGEMLGKCGGGYTYGYDLCVFSCDGFVQMVDVRQSYLLDRRERIEILRFMHILDGATSGVDKLECCGLAESETVSSVYAQMRGMLATYPTPDTVCSNVAVLLFFRSLASVLGKSSCM